MVGTMFLLVFLLVGTVLLLAACIAFLIEVVQRRHDLARHSRWIYLCCAVALPRCNNFARKCSIPGAPMIAESRQSRPYRTSSGVSLKRICSKTFLQCPSSWWLFIVTDGINCVSVQIEADRLLELQNEASLSVAPMSAFL